MENTTTLSTEPSWKIPETPGLFLDEYLYNEIRKVLKDTENSYEIAVGVDSQIYGRFFTFVTVLCIWKKGHGGLYFYKNENSDKAKIYHGNQKMRMFDEVSKALEFARNIEDNTGIKPIVHLDVSSEEKQEFTSLFTPQLKGYVVSSGYEVRIKPESWCASVIADRHTKRYHRKKR